MSTVSTVSIAEHDWHSKDFVLWLFGNFIMPMASHLFYTPNKNVIPPNNSNSNSNINSNIIDTKGDAKESKELKILSVKYRSKDLCGSRFAFLPPRKYGH
ncbi:hypothetical protein H8356DRAFT_1359886 [Neocallimastix lanati (nom. inval.)]|nr:hypothetical protein H8356DRAFT_1359886 [Neocallimastix sp. JGI-2020a]